MLQSVYVALSGLLLLAALASLVLWIRQVIAFWSQGARAFAENLVPVRPRWRPFWGVAEVLIMFGSMLVLGELIRRNLVGRGLLPPADENGLVTPQNAEQLFVMVAGTSVASLGAVAIVLAWMRLIDRDARRKLGLTFCLADAWLGLVAAVMILPPVLLVSAGVNQLVEYEHPVLESLSELASPAVFVVTFIGTAIITPIVEEVMLRGLLQGALQGYADRASDPGGINPQWRPSSFWPIAATSLIFSMMHLGQGAAPIPLFLLSVGLGYLYRQTGSLTAPIVVHMVLNGMTLIAEFSNQGV